MEQFTEEEAIQFAKEEKWRLMTHRERAGFQLYQERLCMPFEVFHEAIEKALDRPVYTHEFALNSDGLVSEYLGLVGHPSLDEIISLLPQDKTIVMVKGD